MKTVGFDAHFLQDDTCLILWGILMYGTDTPTSPSTQSGGGCRVNIVENCLSNCNQFTLHNEKHTFHADDNYIEYFMLW